MFFRLVVFFCMLISSPAIAEKYAFVLGNSAYDTLSNLRNTHADADAYAGALSGLGFTVVNHRDLDLEEMYDAFDAFLNHIAPGDQVTFVYAGHGWSDGATNYLIPTDAPLKGTDRKLKRASMALRNGSDGILDELERAGASLTVAVIDACRNNPFKPTEGTRSAAMSRGLGRVQAATGTFVIFSAGVGQTALDRLPDDGPDQKLSVFTRSFVPRLKSGIYLEDAISKAQGETARLALTYQGHLQHPAYYDQTMDKTCLGGECSVVTVEPALCDILYSEAKEERACYAYEAYLSQCSTHTFSSLAKSYLARRCEVSVANLNKGLGIETNDTKTASNAAIEILPDAPAQDLSRPIKLALKESAGATRNERSEDFYSDQFDDLVQCDRLGSHPNNPDNPITIALVPLTTSNASEAISACQTAIASNPNSLRTKFQLGFALETVGNFDEAFKWYQQAADDGYPIAERHVGYFYASGKSVTRDLITASEWYKKSAFQGYVIAQSNLGHLYYGGYGVEKSYTQALFWFNKARVQGDRSSWMLVDKIERLLNLR